MIKLLKELRRREVFRTTGLYVGICWILIEVSSVVLPAFDAPDWVFRGTIYVAIAGFPVMLVLAWFFDASKDGISLQDAGPNDPATENLGIRKSDFAIMGVLVLALIVSLSLNLKSNNSSEPVEARPVLVTSGDFTNTTGDPSLDLVLKTALIADLEVAPEIGIVDRNGELTLTGSIEKSGAGFRLSVEGSKPGDASSVFSAAEEAASRDAILPAINELSATARKKLGIRKTNDEQGANAQNFSASSVDAVHAFALARAAETQGNLEIAAQHYQEALSADPDFGPAYANLAIAEFLLGQNEAATEHWTKALSLASTVTEREWLRAQGHYYTSAVIDQNKAAETYAELVSSFPTDLRAREDYAAVSFQLADFSTAAEQTREALQLSPSSTHFRLQLATYAMYNSDWDTATREAELVIGDDPSLTAAYLPIAMSALRAGRSDSARDSYQLMASANKTELGKYVSELGLADIDLYVGQTKAARDRLSAGITKDVANGNAVRAAFKHIALAQSFLEHEDLPAATTAATQAVRLADNTAIRVSAAMVYIAAGKHSAATDIIDTLSAQTDVLGGAYAQMLRGMILEREGAQTDAILAFRDALDKADLWLIRYQLGKAYFQAGNYPEALDELSSLQTRSGEASAVFLDGMPSYRLMAEVPYWTGRVQEALNIPDAAKASYGEYVSLRPLGGALVRDANLRMVNLNMQ